jgi:hypothetical protein
MAGISDFLFGSGDKLKKIQTGTPQQQQAHSNILQQLMQMQQPGGGYNQAQDYFSNLLCGQGYQDFSEPYLQQFHEQILPRIAEQFAGKGALSSSGFGQALGGAASGLESQLAQLFSGLQGQAAQSQLGQFNQLANTGLGYQPFSYQNQQGSPGIIKPLAAGLGFGFANQVGNLGASAISSLFKQPGAQMQPNFNFPRYGTSFGGLS